MNVVKSFLGHSDIATTERYYLAVDEDHLSKAAKTMNDLLKKADAGTTDHFADHLDNSESNQEKTTSKNGDYSSESQYPRCDSNAQPLAPEANALSN
jgi:hypothetical protein